MKFEQHFHQAVQFGLVLSIDRHYATGGNVVFVMYTAYSEIWSLSKPIPEEQWATAVRLLERSVPFFFFVEFIGGRHCVLLL